MDRVISFYDHAVGCRRDTARRPTTRTREIARATPKAAAQFVILPEHRNQRCSDNNIFSAPTTKC